MTCQMVYHNGNCLNTKRPYARSCKLCIESCPHNAISEYRELDPKRCTECGVCMAVCPSGGFVDHSLDKLHNYLLESEKIILNCPKAAPLGFEIPCLGILDRDSWMTLMLLAKEKTVTIITGVCSACKDREACASSVEIFKQVHRDWPEHPAVKINVRPDQGSAEELEIAKSIKSENAASKPELGWRQRSREKIEEWLPSISADESYQIPKTRQWLIEAFEASEEKKIPFHALSIVDDSCTNCGVCAAICPQGALQKQEEMNSDPDTADQTKEDQITALRLIFEPQKCVQCHRCAETCPSKALTFNVKPLSHRLITGKILVHEGRPKYCNRCGKRIFDNGEFCLVCATSDPANRGFFSL